VNDLAKQYFRNWLTKYGVGHYLITVNNHCNGIWIGFCCNKESVFFPCKGRTEEERYKAVLDFTHYGKQHRLLEVSKSDIGLRLRFSAPSEYIDIWEPEDPTEHTCG
jgi:hypothetical protein